MILLIGGNKLKEVRVMDHEKICEEYYGFIYNLCYQKLKNVDLAKDAAQTVILIYLQKKDSFDDRVILSTWFAKTSLHVCFWFFKEQKKGRKFEQLPSAETIHATESALDQEENQNLKEKLQVALNEISPYHRGILMMLYYEKKTFAEIGKQFQKGENAIRKGRQVAEIQLKKVLNQKYQGQFNRAIDLSLFALLKEISFKPDLSFINLNIYQPYAIGVLKMVFIQKVILCTTCIAIVGASGFGITKFAYANEEAKTKTEVVETKKDAKKEIVAADKNIDISKKMETLISFDYTDIGFKDCLEELSQLVNITIVFDKNLFAKGAVDPDTPISLKVRDLPAKNALKLILSNVNAEYSIKDQSIYISSKKK